MEPIGVRARWCVALAIIHVTIAIMSTLLSYYWGLLKDMNRVSQVVGFGYLFLGIYPILRLRTISRANQARSVAIYVTASWVGPMLRLSILSHFLLSKNQSLAWNDDCEGCYSILRLCFGVMVLLNFLETIVAFLIYDGPSRRGDMELMVGNTRVRVGLGRFGGVLIRCGRVLGGVDGLVAWRLGLGSMSAMLLTLVLGGFGSVMTANVLWTCLALAFLETILVCASREKIFDDFVRFRYIFVSVVKIVLVGYLIMDVYLHPFTESSGCTKGSACYSRLRECFWVMLVLYSLEVFLALLLLFFRAQRRESNIRTDKLRRILSLSMALSMTQIAIVGLLLGGSYGPLMTARGFWLCAMSGIVEMAALMGIIDWVGKAIKTQIDTGMSFLNNRSAFIMFPALRIISLFLNLILLDRENALIADMSNCNEICKARGRDLMTSLKLAGSVQFLLSVVSFMSVYNPVEIDHVSILEEMVADYLVFKEMVAWILASYLDMVAWIAPSALPSVEMAVSYLWIKEKVASYRRS